MNIKLNNSDKYYEPNFDEYIFDIDDEIYYFDVLAFELENEIENIALSRWMN